MLLAVPGWAVSGLLAPDIAARLGAELQDVYTYLARGASCAGLQDVAGNDGIR